MFVLDCDLNVEAPVSGHFKDLRVWKNSIELVRSIYSATDRFPKRETYSLADQMRRAAVSVPSNIAEGQAYSSRRQFIRFLRHARGSVAELETQLIIATDLKYMSVSESDVLLRQLSDIGRMLSGLIQSLQPATGVTEEAEEDFAKLNP